MKISDVNQKIKDLEKRISDSMDKLDKEIISHAKYVITETQKMIKELEEQIEKSKKILSAHQSILSEEKARKYNMLIVPQLAKQDQIVTNTCGQLMAKLNTLEKMIMDSLQRAVEVSKKVAAAVAADDDGDDAEKAMHESLLLQEKLTKGQISQQEFALRMTSLLQSFSASVENKPDLDETQKMGVLMLKGFASTLSSIVPKAAEDEVKSKAVPK